MKSYYEKSRLFMSRFKDLKIQAIRRELNSQADGEYSKKNNLNVKEYSAKKEEEKLREVNMIDVSEEFEEERCQMKDIIDFLQDNIKA